MVTRVNQRWLAAIATSVTVVLSVAVLWDLFRFESRKARASAVSFDGFVGQLASKVAAERNQAFSTLLGGGAMAIPALVEGCSDPKVRHACVEIMAQLPESDIAPILVDFLRDSVAAPSPRARDRRFHAFIVGALGRLEAKEAISLLTTMYDIEESKGGLMGVSLAWALERITGKEYSPSFDPWLQGT